jgi:hypothetical protein
MKKLIFFLSLIISLASAAQDSSKITVSITILNKDVNFISNRVYDNDYLYGDLRDSISAKSRGTAEGDDNTSVTLTAHIGVFLTLANDIQRDVYALWSNTYKRFADALKLLNTQSYLIRKLGEQEAAFDAEVTAIKLSGRKKKRRSAN